MRVACSIAQSSAARAESELLKPTTIVFIAYLQRGRASRVVPISRGSAGHPRCRRDARFELTGGPSRRVGDSVTDERVLAGYRECEFDEPALRGREVERLAPTTIAARL